MSDIFNSGLKCCPAHSHGHATTSASTLREYAFEMACSNIRYGPGVTSEIGMDAANLGAKRALLVTDKTVRQLPPFQLAIDSLTKAGVPFDVYDRVQVEPTDASFQEAIDFAKKSKYDVILAVGKLIKL